MAFHDVLYDSETQAGPTAVAAASCIHAVKSFGESGKVDWRDAVAAVGYLKFRDPPVAANCHRDLTHRARATVSQGIGKQIVEQLKQLGKIASNRRQFGLDIVTQRGTARLGERAGVVDRDRDKLGKIKAFGRRNEAIGLDPRKAHQVFHYPKHAACLIAYGVGETSAECLVERTFFGQCFRGSEDGCEGCAQFMAGIGDEVGAHRFSRPQGGKIDKAEHLLPVVERTRDEPPMAIGSPGTGYVHRSAASGENQSQSAWMSNGQADVAADDALSEQGARGVISADSPVAVDQQGRLVDGFEQSLGDGGQHAFT